MAIGLRFKADMRKARENLGKIQNDMDRAIVLSLIQTMQLIGFVSTSKYMETRSFSFDTGFGPRRNFRKLHINSGRLARSLIDQFAFSQTTNLTAFGTVGAQAGGDLGGTRESIREITRKTSGKWVARYGSEVPYARRHERGGSQRVTKNQRGFFWHKYFDTGGEMWKRMALSNRLNYPPRPYLRPATLDAANSGRASKIFDRNMREVTRLANLRNRK